MTRWRKRMGEDKIVALIQESLNVATRVGAAKPSDFTSIIVDTTVQPKAVAFPTDAKLMHAPARTLSSSNPHVPFKVSRSSTARLAATPSGLDVTPT